MFENYFILCSTDEDCNPLYWSLEEGWTPEEGRATRYDKSILTLGTPLPAGLGAIIEKTPKGQDVRFYGVIDLPLSMGGFPWFEASEFI
jgi:hypothetical protein